jgi:hypothetical protein
MKRVIGYLVVVAVLMTTITFLPAASVQVEGNNSGFAVSAADVTVSVATPTNLKVKRENSTSLALSWNKVAGASGYQVYKWNAKAKKYKRAETLKGANQLIWTEKKLNSKAAYRYKVRAYKNVDEEKRYSAFTYVVHAIPYADRGKKVNAKSVNVDYVDRCLGLRGVKKVAASVNVPKGKSALSKTLAWKSSNPSIVKVSKNGWIRAQGKPGKAKVYIRAHNGVKKTLNITVTDYAHPVTFSNLNQVKKCSTKAFDILSTYKDDMCTIVAALEQYKSETDFYYEGGELQVEGVLIDYAPVEDLLTNLTKSQEITVSLRQGIVSFYIFSKDVGKEGVVIEYSDFNGKDNIKDGIIKIAPCWYAIDGNKANGD